MNYTTKKKFDYIERKKCVCGSYLTTFRHTLKKEFNWGTVTFLQCPDCKSWCQSPQINTKKLAQWFDSDDYQATGTKGEGVYINYKADEKHRQMEAQTRYERDLKPILKKKAKVLEVGCATGSLLSVLRNKGHVVFGADISSKFAEQAYLLNGIDVTVCDFLEFSSEPSTYDFIIMLGTISNLQDLPRHLRHAHALLSPNGFLYINFPASDSLMARLYGKKIWMFTPSVINFLSKKGCKILIEKSGFKLVQFKIDRQRPSVSKIIGHANLKKLYPLACALKIGDAALPIALPIPGVHMAVAQKNN
jgi:SAM-dependent methyltransferase